MTTAELLGDAFDRIREVVHNVCDGVTAEELLARPTPHCNSIAWLIWHLSRIQDDHIAEVAGVQQVWTAGGWAAKFALPFADSETGYGDTPEQVAAVAVTSAGLLTGYYDAVHAQTLPFVAGLTDSDLDRVVDENWVPPVTLGVRLVSVISDDLQHAGQAAYLKGLLRG
jgi:hypothetical protein